MVLVEITFQCMQNDNIHKLNVKPFYHAIWSCNKNINIQKVWFSYCMEMNLRVWRKKRNYHRHLSHASLDKSPPEAVQVSCWRCIPGWDVFISLHSLQHLNLDITHHIQNKNAFKSVSFQVCTILSILIIGSMFSTIA